MQKRDLFKGGVALSLLFSAQVVAVPFASIDPGSLGMGGAGVASGNSGNAGFMNPALLSAAEEGERFALELPIIGVRLVDSDDVLEGIDAYKDGALEANFDASIEAFNSAATPAELNAAAVGVISASQTILNQLLEINNKTIEAEFVGGLVVGIPNRRFGASLQVSARFVGGGILSVTQIDQNRINALIADAQTGVVALANNQDVIDASNGEDISDTLTSEMLGRGAIFEEVGLSLAHEVTIAGQIVSVGLTPKYVRVTTFDYALDVQTADFDGDTGKKEYKDFNLDFGLLKNYGNGWTVGFVAKNLIAQEYETVLGNRINIDPQARVGISHATEWVAVALDVDLTENDPVGLEKKSRYVALGAELAVWETMQLRIGYRHNAGNSDLSIATVGFGLSVFGGHIDLAVAGNDKEIGGALQTGFRF